MKKTLLFLAAILLATTSFAQEGINYKAIISDAGAVVASQSIDLKFTILESGTTSVYQETHAVNTDANGIVVVNIGEGDYETGDWPTIDWRKEQFLKVEVNIGSGFTDMGTTAFKTVPHAKSADKLMPTDRVVIGDDSMNHGERLYIEVPTVESSELVDFIVDSPVQEDNIINLEFGTVPTSGNAQFIEARAGGDLTFKVNHTGAIYTAGGIDADNDINIFNGDLNAYNNATVSGSLGVTGDLAVTGNVTTDLEMGANEIHSTATGDADLKALMYGRFSIGSGLSVGDPLYIWDTISTDGFSVEYRGVGKYLIIFDDYSTYSDFLKLIVQVTVFSGDYPDDFIPTIAIVDNEAYTSGILIKQYNLNGNLTNAGAETMGHNPGFEILVFKK